MNDDLISKSALLNERPEYLNTDHTDVEKALFAKGWNACNSEYYSVINNAPAVDAEVVRHGRWGRFGKTHYRIVCSACKFPTPFKKQANGYHLAWKSNYCPNCGAKMEQEDN